MLHHNNRKDFLGLAQHQKVTFDQKGNADLIDFERNKTFTLKVERSHSSHINSRASVTQNPSTKDVTVVLNPPVPPGSTVTIRLLPERNPYIAGYYLFGVRAFPAGDNSHGQRSPGGFLQENVDCVSF